MRKNTFIVFGVVALFVVGCFVYFKQVKKEIPPVVEPVVQVPVNTIVETKTEDFCFYKETSIVKKPKDVMWLKLTTNGKDLTGELHILPSEKDKKTGTFSGGVGTIDTSAMSGYSDLWWNTNGEGTVQKEELRIALASSEKGAEASIGFGAMVPGVDGVYIYKDKEALTYQSMPQVGCTQFNSLIKNAFVDTTKTFSFDYLKDFSAVSKIIENTPEWSMFIPDTKGNVLATVTIPRSLQPNTNFSEARFRVGVSSDKNAVAMCVKGDEVNKGIPTKINGIDFIQFDLNEAAVGNVYETVSYRTVFKDKCYAVETTVHSSNIDNYIPEQNIKEYDHDAVSKILKDMVNSFIFTGSSKPALL
ncbi:MAG: hypothetical protein ACR2IQ_00910 [Minisyncoccia bacterium]